MLISERSEQPENANWMKLDKEWRVDETAMIRNRYNRIPHPAPNGKGTYTTETELNKTARLESQLEENSSFPADSDQVILNKGAFSVPIELNVSREWFSSIAIELKLVRRGHGLKKCDSICASYM